MPQLLYVLQFKGQAGPVEGAANMMRAATSAAPCSISTRIGSEGIRTELQALDGPSASFESEVTLIGDTSIVESGTIRFGARRERAVQHGRGRLPGAEPRRGSHGRRDRLAHRQRNRPA